MKFAAAMLAMLAVLEARADELPTAMARGLYLGAGVMQPQSAPQLSAQDGHGALTAGLSWRYSRHIALELDVLDAGQAADMPQVERSRSGTPGVRQREHINIDGIGIGLHLIYPYGKLEPYVGGGVGYYASEVSDHGTVAHFVLPNEVAKRKDNGVGSYLALGVEYALSPTSALRLEYRWLQLEADFGAEFGGPVKIGGGTALLAFRGAVR